MLAPRLIVLAAGLPTRAFPPLNACFLRYRLSFSPSKQRYQNSPEVLCVGGGGGETARARARVWRHLEGRRLLRSGPTDDLN